LINARYLDQTFDTTGVTRRWISNDRQYNWQQKIRTKKTNNCLQSTTRETNKWVTRISREDGSRFSYSGRAKSFCFTRDTRRVNNSVISDEQGKKTEIVTKANVIKRYISNLVHTARFWNNLLQVRSKSKNWRAKYFNINVVTIDAELNKNLT